MANVSSRICGLQWGQQCAQQLKKGNAHRLLRAFTDDRLLFRLAFFNYCGLDVPRGFPSRGSTQRGFLILHLSPLPIPTPTPKYSKSVEYRDDANDLNLDLRPPTRGRKTPRVRGGFDAISPCSGPLVEANSPPMPSRTHAPVERRQNAKQSGEGVTGSRGHHQASDP